MSVPATAPTQLPLDAHNWDKNGVLVVADDLRQTLWNTISEFDYALADLYAYTNGVMGISGLQISNAASGMTINIGQGRARALGALKVVQLITPGALGQPAAFSTTLTSGAGIPLGQSRIDVIALQYDWVLYTDGNGENHTVDNTNIKVIVGTAGVTPVAPALPDNSYVQLGTVTVPSGATTIAQCTINNAARTTYQDLGALGAAVPTGVVLEYDGTTAPNSYFYMLGPTGGPFSDGTYDPTVDLGLASVVGNRHGTKSGRYLLPDKTGRSGVGPDIAGTTIGSVLALGGTLGASTYTLIVSNLPSHTHVDSGHVHGTTESAHIHTQVAHSHTDTGHAHSYTDPTHAHGFTGVIGAIGNAAPLAPTLGQDNGPDAPITSQGVQAAGIGITINNGAAVLSNSTPAINGASTGLAVNSSTAAIQNTGGGVAHTLVQPVLCFNYIIRR